MADSGNKVAAGASDQLAGAAGETSQFEINEFKGILIDATKDLIPLPAIQEGASFFNIFLNNCEQKTYNLQTHTMEAEIISCLFFYPDFNSYWSDYWTDPDTTVVQIAPEAPEVWKDSCAISAMDKKALVHLIIITMRKNLYAASYATYCEKRFKAFYGMMRHSNSQEPHISYECMSRMKLFFDKTPRLVRTIFRWVQSKNALPEFRLAYEFLNFSQLGVIRMSEEFVGLGESTPAHKNPRVIAEGKKLKEAIAKIKDTHGSDWGYIRLQREASELNCTNFKYLVKAALDYFKSIRPEIRNLKSKFIEINSFDVVDSGDKVAAGASDQQAGAAGETSQFEINELKDIQPGQKTTKDLIPLPAIQEGASFFYIFLDNCEQKTYNLQTHTMEAEIISCLFFYPDFNTYWSDYWTDPDTTVVQIAPEVPLVWKDSCTISYMDRKALVYFIIITMRKNLYAATYATYCEKRFKAFYGMMRHSNSQEPHISYECMSRMKLFFDKTPRLVRTIFKWVQSNTALPEFRLAYEFLNFSQLGVIRMCEQFVSLGEFTPAHRHPRVIAEGKKLKAAIAKINETHGSDWGYIRLQCEAPELNCTNFKYLVKAALAYFKSVRPEILNLKSKFIKTKLFETDVKDIIIPAPNRHLKPEFMISLCDEFGIDDAAMFYELYGIPKEDFIQIMQRIKQ